MIQEYIIATTKDNNHLGFTYKVQNIEQCI